MRRSEFVLGALGTFAPPLPLRDGGVLRLDAAPLGHDIDPYRDTEPGVDELSWLYADGLVGWDRGAVPLLAARLPDVTDDGRTYRYRLRAAEWHDGRPFTGHDVAEAFAAVRATPWGTREPYASVREVVVEEDRAVSVHVTSTRSDFVRSFFGPYGTPGLPLIRHAGAGPIGTGPFAVRAHPDLGRWSLERWESSPRGKPAIGAIELRILTSDVTANVQLLAGETDVALPLPSSVIGADRFERVRRLTSTAVLLINADGLLKTPAVRRAFAAVADVPALQKAYSRRTDGLLASLMLSGPNDLGFAATLAYRPDATASLNGLTRPRPLVLAYVSKSPAHERTMTLLQQNLAAAGVTSELRPYPAQLYTGESGPLRTGRFDVAMNGLVYADESGIEADWSCANRPPAGGNFARWCDASFDGALLRRDVGAALRRVYDATIALPLARAYEEIGVSPRVGGFNAPPPLVPATYACVAWTLNGPRRNSR